ncbi:Glucitol operon repressor [Austwickia sp. TVS 96-490-7B]|uniref:DeoR/GlpR family DNA-binding transcription regulator n=1 Tax=Austwickia sp. TVS 96-490-7B TaxID=2830843 RepID=UPI001C55B8B7|nr:DeoR/GlpR family DNA-binding transcription regulator [Austwickia sp. TVS 96-490-7B]MBW3084726.1 Glucitol operon repressor [Austwickia sp. TVS 96-490-7B]
MRLNDRQRVILSRLHSGDYVEVKDLADALDVDVSTIRRDLQTLTKSGLVERLHGGVRIRHDDEGTRQNASRVRREHLAIAAAARRTLRNGHSIGLSSGPISEQLVPLLFDLDELTIVTHDLRAADALSRHAQFRVFVAGGELRDGTGQATTSGPDTAAYLENHPTDWAFLEVDGVHPFAGLTTSAPWRVSAHRALLAAGRRRCVLASSRVFGVRCVGYVAEVDAADIVITDEHLDDEDLPPFHGKVVRAALDPSEDWRPRT